MVAEAELLKMVPLWALAGMEPDPPTRFTHTLVMLDWVQPVWYPTGIPLAEVVPVTL